MPTDKQKNRQGENNGDPKKADSSKKNNDKVDKSSDTDSDKEPQFLDLEKLKKTTTTHVPVSTIAGTVRTRVVSSTGPKMDWKFSIIAGVATMFLGLVTDIFRH